MRNRVKLLVCFGFILVLCNLGSSVGVGTPKKPIRSRGTCLSEDKLAHAVLSLSADYSKAQEASHLLRESSRRSSTCREKIIAAVMRAMDKPNLDISRDQASADLWREGAILLGDLKAVQALDLLLSHINMNDGEWSMTMVHQPALEGIIRIGRIAVPRLRTMLRNNSDREVRHNAVYCLAYIGGPSARRVLQEVLPSESDACVKRFISAAIEIMDSKSGGTKADRGEWLSAFLCKNS
jgi:HEAT repeat protein